MPLPRDCPWLLGRRRVAKRKEHGAKRKTNDVLSHEFFAAFFFCVSALSLNHFISPRQHIRRYRQADLLGRFQIDDELELCRLLDWEIGGLGAFQNPVDVSCSAPV